MFTGLIQAIGEVKQILRPSSHTLRLTVQSALAADFVLGASVSINGACHTVVHIDKNFFVVESSPETMSKTNFKTLRVGDKVNLEPALKLNQGLDGHLVQGHVDGIGRITACQKKENAIIITISADREIIKFLVPKGSVAVEGVSLTVVGCYSDRFSVCLIPHSANNTTLGNKRVGAAVNLETDILSKYVAKQLNPNF